MNPTNAMNLIAVWQQDRCRTAGRTGSSPASRMTVATRGRRRSRTSAPAHDFRENTPTPGVPTDYWIVHCHALCTDPASCVGNENRLTMSSFDIEQAPAARGPFGYFLGEYQGLTNVGSSFAPVFVAVNDGDPANRTDVFSTTAG